MISHRWLTGRDDLSAVLALRQMPADSRDAAALHILVSEGERELATGRLIHVKENSFIDMLGLAPGADPECLVLAVQMLVFKAADSGAAAVFSSASGSLEKLLLAAGFLYVPPGEEPSATLVFRPGCGGRACGGCDGCERRVLRPEPEKS